MRNFVIVGTQRTGSSSIAESIGLHPAIACGWEWTLHVPRWKKVAVAEAALSGNISVLREPERAHISSVLSDDCRWLGYRNLFRSSDKWLGWPGLSPALWLDGFGSFLRWFQGNRDVHVVHIVRNDNLAWIRSKYLSKRTGAYVGRSYPSDLKVEVDVRNAVRRVMAKRWLDDRLLELSFSNPYIRVEYEEYSKHATDQIARIWEFLGCEPIEVDVSQKQLRPQSSVPPEEQIANYDSLVEALRHSGLLGSE